MTTLSKPNLIDIKAPVASDMEEVNAVILSSLDSRIDMIREVAEHLIQSGGKRLRPMITLLSAKACGYDGEDHYQLATIIEFIHTATLLHDDVVDASILRRGQDTANAVWGNEASILVGDFVYSRTFQLINQMDNPIINQVLAYTTNYMAEGEVQQLINRNQAQTSEASYMDVIEAKTAKLFEAATKLAAIISNVDDEKVQAMSDYGFHLGTAFQLVDDLLDYTASSDDMGKNLGDDLAEGKPTLPLIYALKHGNKKQQAVIKQTIETGGLDNLDIILTAIKETKALEYTRQIAEQQAEQAKQAIQIIPDSIYRQALIDLVDFCIERSH